MPTKHNLRVENADLSTEVEPVGNMEEVKKNLKKLKTDILVTLCFIHPVTIH